MTTGFLIDMDGVIYRENQLIPGAKDFVRALIGNGTPFIYTEMGGRAALEQVVVIGDTMETDIRGAVEAGLQSYLVLSGSTRLENLCDYVYQPTRVLNSVADIVEEIRTGKPSSRLDSPVFSQKTAVQLAFGNRHQTDAQEFKKPRPRVPMAR